MLEIVDYALSLLPDLPSTHPHALRRTEERIKYIHHNDKNVVKRFNIKMREWRCPSMNRDMATPTWRK